MTNLESIEDATAATRALGRAALSADLATVIDKLKIRGSILHSLGMIEQCKAVWIEGLYSSEARACAYANSAMLYGELSIDSYVSLTSYITERAAIRRDLLQKMLDQDQVSETKE